MLRSTINGLTRRRFLALFGGALAASVVPARGFAGVETGKPLHGLSAFGDLKYGPDFTHFDYASPEAPKGGTFNFMPPNWVFNQNPLTFNTLNTFARRGDAPQRMEMCFDSLMVRAIDEPDAIYGLLAESVTIGDDGKSYVFRLRSEARFHDGTPVTAADVAFTYLTFKDKGHASLVIALRELEDAVAQDERNVRLVFTGEHSQRSILSVATLPIVSKAFYSEHPFDSSQLEPPLGSGPYKVGRFAAGRYIEYDRVEDYWARDLPVNRGLYNFGRIRIEFYRERQAAFEAFKKGNVLYRQEFTSRVWATGYDFPAIRDGKVVKREFPAEKSPIMQAWALNQRRSRFADSRVRHAISLCFDFEWTRQNLFYGAYERSQSTFERSPYMAEGMPSPEELALLEKFRGRIPDEAFGEAVTMEVSDGSGRDRKLLGKAARLLTEAGWTRRDGLLRNEAGEVMAVEILVQDQVFVRANTPFVENMRAIGIDASIRLVDAAQFQARQLDFDFDMVGMAAAFAATPTGESLSNLFHSRAAEISGSRNFPGTSDPAVDALIEIAAQAGDRSTFTTAMRALDRVLRARRDWIPNWHAANHRAAFWDMFGFKEPKPDYGFPVEALWWADLEKAKAIGKG
nr:extracellular solute-binding protein [Mesorhizobium xinjiangense]